MEKNKKYYEDLAKKVNGCKTDIELLQVLKDNNKDLMVVLDNDCSVVTFVEPEGVEEEYWEFIINNINLNRFEDYHSYASGVFILFEFAGITAEAC